MKTNDPILVLANEYRRADRAMGRHLHNEDPRKWNAAYDALHRTGSKLLRSKPVTFEGAGTLVAFVARELSDSLCQSTSNMLKVQARELQGCGFAYGTWTYLNCINLLLKKHTPQNPGLRIFRRAIRAVLRFVQAKGGKVDPRRLSIRPV